MIRWRMRSGVSPRDTYETLVRTSSVALMRHAERLYPDDRDAEDAVADAFEQAWRAIDAGGVVNLSWLMTCIDNRRRDRDKRERTREKYAGVLSSAARGSAMRDENVELRVDLGRVLSMLPLPERKLIELLDLDGYTAGEVAGLLGISQAAVRKRHQRARESLGALLVAAGIGLKAGDDHVA